MPKIRLTLFAGTYGIQRMAAEHAPKGGITISGKQYRGGQFIPSEVIAKASAADKAKLKEAKENAAAATASPSMATANKADTKPELAPSDKATDEPKPINTGVAKFQELKTTTRSNMTNQAKKFGMPIQQMAKKLGFSNDVEMVNFATGLKALGLSTFTDAVAKFGFKDFKSLYQAVKKNSPNVPKLLRDAVRTGVVQWQDIVRENAAYERSLRR